jgi:hypothetical protein
MKHPIYTDLSPLKNYVDNNFLFLSGGLLSNNLTVSGYLSSTNTIYSVEGNSSNWQSVYSTVQNTSSNWNTSYQQISANDIVRSNLTLESPVTGISAVRNMVVLYQSSYDDLVVKTPNTFYIIV